MTLTDRYLNAPLLQARSLDHTSHRPWPLPQQPWLMGQSWRHLLFGHWRVDAAALRPHVPPELTVDEHDGSAWIGVTPFQVEGLRVRSTFPLPILSNFLELNVRTYVSLGGDRPGIWFFGLHTPARLAVLAARVGYLLPYRRRRLTLEQHGDEVLFIQREDRSGAGFAARYRPTGTVRTAAPGSLEAFLVERYCLYSGGAGAPLLRADIHHRPWPLQDAEAAVELRQLAPDGVDIEGRPLAHYSERQDVVIWAPEHVRG